MLGEQISAGNGKRSGRRVVTIEPRVIVEVSFEERSKLLGVDGINLGTYTSSTRPDGTLTGDGQGIFATPSGDIATWKGGGNGRYQTDGSISYRGAIMFSSSSPAFSRLNAVGGVFEFDIDADGNTRSKIWEWK